MLQTCKHDTAKLIFQKVLIFWFNNFFFYLQIFKLLSLISAFLVQYNMFKYFMLQYLAMLKYVTVLYV